MHVFVEVAKHEHLVVVSHGLAFEELLGLLESSLVLGDFVGLSIEHEAVRDPAVVAAEDKDF